VKISVLTEQAPLIKPADLIQMVEDCRRDLALDMPPIKTDGRFYRHHAVADIVFMHLFVIYGQTVVWQNVEVEDEDVDIESPMKFRERLDTHIADAVLAMAQRAKELNLVTNHQ
jgi:hypothetical protein